jgi:hypothetical protein
MKSQELKKIKPQSIIWVNSRLNLLNSELNFFNPNQKMQKDKDFKSLDLVMLEFV